MTADIIILRPPPALPRFDPDRILRDIRNAGDDSHPLQRRAVAYFAKLNGWSVGSKRNYPFDQERIHDHAIYLSRALVVQPYGYRDWTEVGEDVADRYRLAVHVPPHPLASIYAPGHAAFLVFTKPGHEMTWLPEQISGLDREML